MVFAMQVSRSGTLSAGNPAIGGNQASSLRYLHHDHLGSVAAITDGTTGAVIERLAFDPWGKRRNVNGQADVTDALVGQTTDRGYTEHEHLDEMGIIHMNGRVYDPLVGRMMSADPFIQAPGSLQSYNRYSYVMNNPLNLTDPSGYFSLSRHLKNPFRDFNNHGDRIGGAILGAPFGPKGYHAVFNFLQGSGGYQLKSAVISGLSIFCGYAVAACNGGGQAGLAKAYGASDWDAFNTGGVAALSAGAFQAAGSLGGGSYWAHAAAGCVSAAAGGGNCGRGAVSAVFGKFVTNELSISGSGLQYDFANGVIAATAGGVGSVIAGGKFENGAKTAAYGYLFNQLSPNGKDPNIRGNMAVEQAKQMYIENGFTIYGEQVTAIINGMPNRIYDFVAIDSGQNYYGVEVKSSLFDVFKLNSQQVSFDTAVYGNGAAIAASALQITRVGYVGVGWGGSTAKNFASARLYKSLQDSGVTVITTGGAKILK